MASPLLLLDRAAALLADDHNVKALSILRKIRASSLPLASRAEYFHHCADAFSALGRYLHAYRSVRRAVGLYRRINDRAGLQTALLRLGDIERQRENPRQALALYRRAARMKGGALALDAQTGEALSLRSLGRFRSARQILSQLLGHYRQRQDFVGQAHILWALATTDRFLGDIKRAEPEARASIQLYRRLKDQGGLAFAWAALGGILRMKGFAQESGKAYRKAHAIFKRHRDEFGLAYASCGIGNSFRMKGQYAQAIMWSTRAAKIYTRLKMNGPLAYVLWASAQSQGQLGRRAPAHANLKRVEQIFRRVRDVRGNVYAQLGWGIFYHQRDVRRSTMFFRRALHLSQKHSLQIEATHARCAISKKFLWRSYQRLGIHPRRFKAYQTLP